MKDNGENPNPTPATERTFLAWTRTSIALMVFSFVVVKFSLFVRQLSLVVGAHPVAPATDFFPVLSGRAWWRSAS